MFKVSHFIRNKMAEKSSSLEQELCSLYYDPAFGYQDARGQGLNVSREKVKRWLHTQSTYTRFKQPTKAFKRRQTYASSIGEQLQMDLVDMTKYEDENDGCRWILTAIDVFTRFAFATLVRLKHGEFMEPAVKEFSMNTRKSLTSTPTWCNLMTEESFITNVSFLYSIV